jgi:Holliday junction resolvase RusA-like endonuclease
MNSTVNFTTQKKANYNNGIIEVQIIPFTYVDGRKPRLPRKSSKGYKLNENIKEFFEYSFSDLIAINRKDLKFKVEIVVNCGNDKLGKADLDNYCKAILDGITSTKKIWLDDKQIDFILLKRIYTQNRLSNIQINISELML